MIGDRGAGRCLRDDLYRMYSQSLLQIKVFTPQRLISKPYPFLPLHLIDYSLRKPLYTSFKFFFNVSSQPNLLFYLQLHRSLLCRPRCPQGRCAMCCGRRNPLWDARDSECFEDSVRIFRALLPATTLVLEHDDLESFERLFASTCCVP